MNPQIDSLKQPKRHSAALWPMGLTLVAVGIAGLVYPMAVGDISKWVWGVSVFLLVAGFALLAVGLVRRRGPDRER